MSYYRFPVKRSASAFGVCMCFCARVQVQCVPQPHRYLLKGGNGRYPSLYSCPYGNEVDVVNVYRLHDAAVQLLWRNTETVL